MKLRVFRNLWGVFLPREVSLRRIAELGYDGVEAVVFDQAQARELAQLLPRHRLDFKGVIWTRGTTLQQVQTSFQQQLQVLRDLGANSISVIGGYDCWTISDRTRYFEFALEAERQCSLPIAHETHRNSSLFHPSVTRSVVEQFPEIKLVLDLSHWVVCAERLIDDQLETIRLCAQRTVHTHVRVGTEQAPQIADLRSSDAAGYRATFEAWWQIVWNERRRAGDEVISICPELGPPPYQITQATPDEAVSELWLQCEWQRERITQLFSSWQAASPRDKIRENQRENSGR